MEEVKEKKKYKDYQGTELSNGDTVVIHFENEKKSDEVDYWTRLHQAPKREYYPESGTGKATEPKMLAIGEVVDECMAEHAPLLKVKFGNEYFMVYSFDLLAMP